VLLDTTAQISGTTTNTSTSVVSSSSSSSSKKRKSTDSIGTSPTSRTKKQRNSKDGAIADVLGMYCNVLKRTVTTLTCFALYLLSCCHFLCLITLVIFVP